MEVSDENVQTLLSMGFPCESEIRKALRLGKNDLNEAVAILTNEPPTTYDALEVEMKDEVALQGPVYGPAPPSYDEAVDTESQDTQLVPSSQDTVADDDSLEFPVTNLYELENRVFTESWSIPYKREESLGKCLIASTRLAEQGLADSQEFCQRFMERCMPDCFQKLMKSGVVNRWSQEIQDGIYNMLQLLMDLVAARLQHHPVPITLLGVLAMTFNPDTEFHLKNKSRRPDRIHWEEKFGLGQVYAVSSVNSNREPFGLLTNLINRFADKKGFEHIRQMLTDENLDAPSMAALLEPFGSCSDMLNARVVQPILAPGMEAAVRYIQGLEENDLKEKKVGSISDLLGTMKLLCLHMWTNDVTAIDELRLDMALRMLKSPHFNARMNALKEVTKLIEDSTGMKMGKTAISQEKITTWLVNNNVLSIALEGNIDQVQYCDKIKNIMDFLGDKLTVEELTKIWKMQDGQNNVVIDNIHSIIAAAAVKFNSQQLENLFHLIHKSWQVENYKMREKLLGLIGKIGKDAKIQKTTTQVLELLWDLSHLPALSTQLVEQALAEHLAILNDSYLVKEQIKRSYVVKCVDDIKEGVWVLPALKQLLHISKNIAKHSFHKAEKGILQELNKNHEIIKLVTNSLVKFHQVAVTVAKENKELQIHPELLVDGRYSHKDYVNTHLNFLQFILQEGVMYLQWHRARDIWDTMVANSDACDWDKDSCIEWFSKGLSDLEPDTQSQIFTKELLRLDAAKLSLQGFNCFKSFFESVNQYEHRLKKSGTMLMVEKCELVGLEYLWEICLNAPDEELADKAVNLLITMSFTNLATRLKRDPVTLHKKFIDECYNRLELAMIPLGGSVVAQCISMATKLLTATSVPEVTTLPSPKRSTKLLNIERLLLIAERYVLVVEEHHTSARTILPHGASFHGYPMALSVISESPKMEFTLQTHSNETMRSIRQKIAQRLKHSSDQIQIVANEKMINTVKDQQLLHQLEFEDHQILSVRGFTTSVSSAAATNPVKEGASPGSARHSFDLEQEKMLPGVVMATGGHVFDRLYQLADLDEPRITTRARHLLKLIPTDPSVEETLDSIAPRSIRQASPEEIGSPKVSPRASPRKFTPAAVPSPKPAPKDVLKHLFDASVAEMSPFRVLYNLEVLSSKLMPPVGDLSAMMSAGSSSFCDDFLNAGGLSLVVNVLQRDTIAADVDYETRQGCYAICLQLARFLLCGETVTGEDVLSNLARERKASVSSASAVTIEVSPTASRSIQTMGVQDFTETVACFMRVAWAAAAGRLHLASSSQPIRENNSVYGGSRSRQSSTGSTASSGSEGDGQTLHAGICIKQSQVSTKDTNIAKEALELLVTCLQLRSQLIASFYSLPCVSDFVIDILVGSPHNDIRNAALEQLHRLSQTEIPQDGSTSQQIPHQFILQVLLKARLPFWVTSCSTRGGSQRLLSQCSQYFDLRCRLLLKLNASDQSKFGVDPGCMLEDEIAWLANFVPGGCPEAREVDNMLLAGHLNLIRTLVTCEGVDKRGLGTKNLVRDLLHDFMFPASKLIMDKVIASETDTSMNDFYPKCSNIESRTAAYRLLTEIADNNLENLADICQDLVVMHHQPNPDLAHEWEYMPPVDSRSLAGFVGLRNGGATCYMNSVLQQLYMAPQVPESILTVDDETIEEESVFHQTQRVFGHLLDSKLQYYVPEHFWKVFRLWGQTVNIREQQDAFDFYQALIDQLDEQLKKLGKEEIFKKKFQGIFSDQKICKDCPHRFEREEVFFSLNVTVKNATLQDSLDQFVKGELLEGENAYFCEKCGEKRNTIKRMCIKTLPPLLCIQLKRFGYDWEANRALKFDDYFKFPWVLDMEPYTAEGMTRREQLNNGVDSSSDSDISVDKNASGDAKAGELTVNTSIAQNSHQINYELVGVVVHSGQANAGHYYSFIKDRRGTCMNNPRKGKWFKFNDTVVEEFEMNEAALENECFGGNYKAKVFDQTSTYPEDRLRYWNGYLLFYERMEDVRTPLSAKRSRVQMMKMPERIPGSNRSSDSLVELTELVHKGEKKGLFTDKMPARIQQLVRDENLRFMKNRDIFDSEYFKFVRILVSKNSSHVNQEKYSQMCVQSLQLGIKFLLNTYFRTKKKLRSDMGEWISTLETLVQRCKEACLWFIEYLGTSEGATYIKPFLLECPTREVRISFAKILERAMASFFHHGGVATHKCFTELLETLLTMLDKDVPENIKTCTQYFWLLSMYVQRGTKACAHMFGRDAFHRLIIFLLGPPTTHGPQEQEMTLRKWSSMQARDFGPLHTTLATLVLNCDLTPYRTEDPENYAIRNPTTVVPQIYLKMSEGMKKYVFGEESSFYLREVVLAVREVGGNTATMVDMLVCCSFCNAAFSMLVMTNVMLQYTSQAPSSELKPLFTLLMQMLLLEDSLQLKRLQCIIDGCTDENGTDYEGMLSVIKLNHSNDSRRSYQCIKFLVSLANKCALAKDYLIHKPSKWQWAVKWLKKKMSDYWSPSANNATSNDDSDSRTFQRTISAQDTLAEATALLTEFEAHEMAAEMDTNAEGSTEQSTDATSPVPSDLVPKTVEALDEVDERL